MTRPALFPALALILLAAPAAAHKVIADLFPAGDMVEGEIGFSSGEMAVNATVTVTGPDGAKLGEARTDADGFFTFRPTRPVAHSFRADLGAGHVAVMELSEEEAARIIAVGGASAPAPAPASAPAPAPAPTAAPAAAEPVAPAPAAAAPLSAAQKAEIARLLRDEIRPLRREISAYKERNDLTTILGGLGWIAGLFGLGFYLAARARLKRGG